MVFLRALIPIQIHGVSPKNILRVVFPLEESNRPRVTLPVTPSDCAAQIPSDAHGANLIVTGEFF